MTDFPTRRLKVFLCHSSGDKQVVRELYRQLTTEEWIEPWLDEMKLLPGQEWDIEIEKAVEEADIVLVCLSTRSVDKEGYIQKELRFVLNIADEKPEGSLFVIPLRLDDCVVPRRLKHWQWVDYFPDSQKSFAYTRLLESFKVRARKLGISFDKPKVEPAPKPVEKAPINPAQDKPAPIVIPQKRKKEETPQPKRESQPKPIANKPKTAESKAVSQTPRKEIPWRLVAGIASGIMFLALFVWGGMSIWNNSPNITPEPIRPYQTINTYTLSQTETSIPPTPAFGIGSTMKRDKDDMTMMYVPVGEFLMGSDSSEGDASPQHTVYLDAFWIDQTEISNAMFADFMNAYGTTDRLIERWFYPDPFKFGKINIEFLDGQWKAKEGFNNYPIFYVASGAEDYCNWVGGHLPTEAEWEKAARGTDGRKYPWGNSFDGMRLNYCDKNCSGTKSDMGIDDGFAEAAPIDSFPNGASPYGVLNMAGNVWEWVATRYHPYPFNPNNGEEGVFRGGSWGSDQTETQIFYRGYGSYPASVLGFRCAMSATP